VALIGQVRCALRGSPFRHYLTGATFLALVREGA
jgi:hypothetical protein